MKKVVLAYSGGLDTSYCVKYLSEEMGLEVYTALANTGGFTPGELAGIEEKAYALGAKKHVTLDVTGEYYEKCIKYMIFGNVLRNKTYPVSVVLSKRWLSFVMRRRSGRTAWLMEVRGPGMTRFVLIFVFPCLPRKWKL